MINELDLAETCNKRGAKWGIGKISWGARDMTPHNESQINTWLTKKIIHHITNIEKDLAETIGEREAEEIGEIINY